MRTSLPGVAMFSNLERAPFTQAILERALVDPHSLSTEESDEELTAPDPLVQFALEHDREVAARRAENRRMRARQPHRWVEQRAIRTRVMAA